jgi:hypothetical protein
MTPETQSTPKVPSVSEATGQRHHDTRHVSVADRLRVKCLEVVIHYNDPMTMYSVWNLGRLGVVWERFIDPLTAPTNRPSWDPTRRHNVHLLSNSCAVRPSCLRPFLLA